MITVLDPALLLTERTEGPLAAEEEKAIADVIDDVARVCRDYRAVIPAVEWYWNKLQREIIRPLHRQISGTRLRQGLDALRAHARPITLAGIPAGKTRMWGVKPLFAWNRLPLEWLDVMERLLIGCAQQDDETILLTRLFPGRNMISHASGRGTLIEKTRWRLSLHISGQPLRHISCVRSPRNLLVPWTTRFDEKLPDRGRFPFCPPKPWWRRDTEARRTYQSKPAWLDRYGNGWAQPATGGEYHWDVPSVADALAHVNPGGVLGCNGRFAVDEQQAERLWVVVQSVAELLERLLTTTAHDHLGPGERGDHLGEQQREPLAQRRLTVARVPSPLDVHADRGGRAPKGWLHHRVPPSSPLDQSSASE